MSTNNPLLASGADLPGVQGELGGAPVIADAPLGLPSVETLTQLANALFAALPGKPAVPGTAADIPSAPPASALPTAPPLIPGGEAASQPVAGYVAPTSGFSPPSDAELRAAPASLAGLGGVPSPATAASPPGEPSYYFLEPDHAALPGAAVGFGPSSASRLESGALPTTPSPPAAFAQPAEPSLSSVPGGAAGLASIGGAPLLGPFAFRPELVPDTTPIPLGGGSSAPTPVPPVTLPQDAGALPPAVAVPPLAAAAPATEGGGPRGSLGGPGLQPLAGVPAGQSFYFLEEAGPHYGSVTPDLNVESFDFDNGLSNVETSAYPLDSRLAGAKPSGQPATVEKVPTGGAPSVVPGNAAATHPLRADTPPSPAIAGVGPG